MISALLHKDVFMPVEFVQQVYSLEGKMKNYKLSLHLQEHLDNQDSEDRSHRYFRNAVINTLNEMISNSRKVLQPFEVEVSKDFHFFGKSGWFVTKYCVRIPFKQDEDLVIVVRPKYNKFEGYDYNNFMIATAWINHKDDSHKTLDESKYYSFDKWQSINRK